MKIAYIVPGAGGGYYCENCLRDVGLLEAFTDAGHELTLIPMYLPLDRRRARTHSGAPVFFGAVNLYLGETFRLYRRLPSGLRRFLGSNLVLKMAARSAGTTRASGLEKLTLSPTELAAALGVGRTRIYRALRTGAVPSLRSGRKHRIPRKVVEQLMADPESFNREEENTR